MDENQTPNDIDALADLFLTGIEPTARPTRQNRPVGHGPNDEVVGPIRLAPKVQTKIEPFGDLEAQAHQEAQRILSPHQSGDEGLASGSVESLNDQTVPYLRLHRADAEHRDQLTAKTPEPAKVLVEAVFLGNLPGVGTPWITQYAQLLAQQDCPVAIVHLGQDQVDLELVQPIASDRHLNLTNQSEDLIELLERLVRDRSMPLQNILVCSESQASGLGCPRLRQLQQWTILFGADQGAVVDTYEFLKEVVDPDRSNLPRRIGLMVMGSNPATSRAAADRVRTAASHFLSSSVRWIGSQQRIGPVNVQPLGSFKAIDELWPQLAAWFGTLSQPRIELLDHSTVGVAEDPEPNTRQRRALKRHRGTSGSSSQPEEYRTATDPADKASSGMRPEGAPLQASRAGDDCTVVLGEEQPGLASLIEASSLPGGVVLDARCPFQSSTELVLDSDGRLHLLRRCAASTVGEGGVDALRAAIMELIETRKWVDEHTQLLQLTQRQCRFDTGSEPVLHLFTERGDLGTALAGRVGSMLKIHLLRHLKVRGEQAWLCTPLS